MLEEVIRFDMNQVRGEIPNIFSVINNANLSKSYKSRSMQMIVTHHAVSAWKQSGHIRSLGPGVETLVSGQNSVTVNEYIKKIFSLI